MMKELSDIFRFFYKVGIFSLVGSGVIGLSILVLWSVTWLGGAESSPPVTLFI